jgi:hypothetical protein
MSGETLIYGERLFSHQTLNTLQDCLQFLDRSDFGHKPRGYHSQLTSAQLYVFSLNKVGNSSYYAACRIIIWRAHHNTPQIQEQTLGDQRYDG